MQNEEELRQILAGLQMQQQPVSIWQRLAEAVARGIGTAASPNPGNALIGQLQEMGAERQRKQEREQSIRNVGVQFQLQDLANRMAEKRGIAAEERANTRQIESEKRAEDRAVAAFNRESGFQEKMSDKQFNQSKILTFIKHTLDADIAERNNKYAINLENLRSSNNLTQQRIGQELSVIVPLLYSGMVPVDVAQSIYDKKKKGEDLTAGENAALAQAEKKLRDQKYREELKQRYASNSNTGESMTRKLNEWALGRAAATNLGMDDKGGIHEISIDPTTRQVNAPPGVKIVKFLNEDEQVDYYRAQAGVKDFANDEQKKKLLEATQGHNVDYFLAEIKKIRDSGGSDEMVKEQMNNLIKQSPKYADAINLALATDENTKLKAKFDEAKSAFDESSGPIAVIGRGLESFFRRWSRIGEENKTVRYLNQEWMKAKNKLGNAKTPQDKKEAEDKIKDIERRLKDAGWTVE